METFSFNTVQGKSDVFYCEQLKLPIIENDDAIYIADTNTCKIAKQAKNFSSKIPFVIIEAGEKHKNVETLQLILKTALDANLSRLSTFIGIGGGVVCDLTAFAASIYMRGVKCCLVPTSLLAMADAAIGGKTAINFDKYKNMIGSFFKADRIYIAPTVLSSLDDDEYYSGLAEIFKITLLYSPTIYHFFLEKKEEIMHRDKYIVLKILKFAISAKADIISRDFYEKNERFFLNFGHTFGHALESLLNFQNISHGVAVAWGISRAMQFGKRLQLTNAEYADEVCQTLKKIGWDTDPIPYVAKEFKNNFAEEIIFAMRKDKKNIQNKIRIILQKDISNNFIYEAKEDDIKAVLI